MNCIKALAPLLALLLCSCGSEKQNKHEIGGKPTEPVVIADSPFPPMPTVTLPTIPVSSESAQDQMPSAGLSYRIDARNPQTLLASLQRVEHQLTPVELDRLRASLAAGQMAMARKIAAISVTQVDKPSFTDEQLFQMAFGEMHNKTVAEIIETGMANLPGLMGN